MITMLDARSITNLIAEQSVQSSGQVFFVNNSTTAKLPGAAAASDTNYDDWGQSPEKPFSTIDYAIGRCTHDRGDIIYILPGHSETHTAANSGATGAITFDVRGVSLIGLGEGDQRPKLLANFSVSTIDLIEVTADSCRIKNLIFQAATTAAPEATIDIAQTDCIVEDCLFNCGAFDTQSITIVAAGDYCNVRNNKFIITANGPEAAIKSDAAADHITVKNNYFDGGSTTNQWDNYAIDFDAAANTLCLIEGNKFLYGSGLNNHASATGLVINNYGGGINSSNVGNCFLIEPALGGQGSISISPDSIGGNVAGEVCLGSLVYVDSGKGSDSNSGGSPTEAMATLDAGINKTTASNGDMLVLLPGHSEDVLTQIDADVAGIKIIGVGNGTLMPTLKNSFAAGTSATLRIDAANIEIAGIRFTAGDTANTIGAIEIVTTTADTYIHDCYIEQGANDVQGITFLGTATRPIIKNNIFRVSANGPDEAIVAVVGALTQPIIENNYFDGGSTTNSWDDGAISSDQANTGVLIKDNIFNQIVASKHAIICSSTTATGAVLKNIIIGNTAEYGINAGELTQEGNIFGMDTGLILKSPIDTTGKYIFVNSNAQGAADTNTGLSPSSALATIDAAVALCTANNDDKIIVLPGHSETLAAVITVDVAGISIIGIGSGLTRPQITVNAVIDGITITSDDAVIDNLYFNEATAAATANINIAAANVTVKNCHFDLGANDLECITWASGADPIILNNEFIVTANGPDTAIEIEGTSNGGIISKNIFNGGSTANTFDAAAINSVVAHTNLVIDDNTYAYCIGHVVATSVSTEVLSTNKYAIGAVPNAAHPITLYADNGSTVRSGLSLTTPTTLADAISKTRAGIGDLVLMLPGTYTLAATLTVSNAGVRIGPYIDNGTWGVIVTTASDVDLFTITGANVEVWGIRFLGNAAQVTTPMLVSIATGDYGRIHHNYIDSGSVAALIGIDIAAGATDWTIDNNYLVGGVATVGNITDAAVRTKIKDNIFEQGAADSYGISGGEDGCVYIDNIFNGDAGANALMINPTAGSVKDYVIARNLFTGTTSATPFGQSANFATQCINNYVANGAGGVLVDPVA